MEYPYCKKEIVSFLCLRYFSSVCATVM
uniref:Uncharacterized protein n=1 Tax=Rhizophora mucronata TaxID=61149 RepID=A0A2P2R236_RHIMU